jgi:hypothetical protein
MTDGETTEPPHTCGGYRVWLPGSMWNDYCFLARFCRHFSWYTVVHVVKCSTHIDSYLLYQGVWHPVYELVFSYIRIHVWISSERNISWLANIQPVGLTTDKSHESVEDLTASWLAGSLGANRMLEQGWRPARNDCTQFDGART